MADILGTANNDALTGTDGDDSLLGFGGDDTLRGLAGNDLLDGGEGNDTIFGTVGVTNATLSSADRIIGGIGTDTLDLSFDAAGGTPTLDFANISGIEALSVSNSNGFGQVTGLGDAIATVNVSDQGSVGFEFDGNSASTINLNLSNVAEANGQLATLDFDDISTTRFNVTLSGTAAALGIANAANGVQVGPDSATSLAINSIGPSANVLGVSGTSAIASVTLAGDQDLTLVGGTVRAGSNPADGIDPTTEFDTTTGFTALTSVDASALTGDLAFDASNALGDVTFIGGQGNDTFNSGTGNDTAFFSVSSGGADRINLGVGSDVVDVSGSAPGQVRLSFTSAEVGNGNAFDAGTLANQDGGLAVRLQAEDGSDGLAGPVGRFDDEGITFSAANGVTFDVRDLVSGVARGDQFGVASLGTSGADTLTAAQADRAYYFNAGAGDDNVTGGSANDFLVGGGGGDRLDGGAGNDSFIAGGGNDVLSGGTGLDVSLYTSSAPALAAFRQSYDFSGSLANGGTVTGTDAAATASGTDTVSGIERFVFVDGTVEADVSSSTAQAYRIYDAAFDRAPDAQGFNSSVDALDNGIGVTALAASFSASTEFQTKYGGLSNRDYVEALYQNALGRTGDAGGATFWTDQLDSGRLTRGDVLVGFSESTEHIELLRSDTEAGLFNVDATAAQVARLYESAFDRIADAAGLRFFTDGLKSGAQALGTVADNFVDSVEFAATFGTLSNDQFVEQLYQNTFERTGDAEGSAFWNNALATGALDRGDVLLGFADSVESRALTAPGQDGILVA